jgi:protein O-GlcNAc transferase
MATISQALAVALSNQQAGRLDLAEQIYGRILQVEPNHCDALNLLGLVAHQRGQHEVAIGHLRRSLAIDARQPEVYNNTGEAYRALGQIDNAAACYRRALALNPGFAAAYVNLGIVLHAQGHVAEAEASLRRAVELQPQSAAAHRNLGIVLQGQGRLAEAVACYQRAVELNPAFFQALCSLGNARAELGELDEAATCYRKALELAPDFVDALCNLAYVLRAQGQLDEALACCRRAVQLAPGLAHAHNNLGEVQRLRGELIEAEASCRRAIALDPRLAQAHCNLGAVVQFLGRPDEALASYRQAIALQPDFAEAYSNLAAACKDMGRLTESVAAYGQALAIDPQPITHSNLLCTLLYSPNHDAQAIAAAHREWEQRHAAPLRVHALPHANVRSATRRLRVGYVSPDFRNHVVGWNLRPLLRHHDRAQVEVFCYADVAYPDRFTLQLRELADRWRSVVGWSDAQLAAQIRDDGVDILVDLALHMAGNRLLCFARRPAPVQVTFAGYPGTTGLSAIDYRLTDRYLDPEGSVDDCYAEESVRLDSFWCYEPLDDGPAVGALPALGRGSVTFGCLNNFCKVNDAVLRLWAQALQAVERSRLMVLAPEGTCRAWALDVLQEHGVASDRVTFVPSKPRAEYLALYREIDIGLDTFPYNGHSTSLDSFWMGVPVVSLVGNTVVGRAGLSMLSNLGLTELVAHTPAEFVHIAGRLASDLPRLAQLRATLRQRMQQSSLMDAPHFARSIEAAYRRMWQRWCAAEHR